MTHIKLISIQNYKEVKRVGVLLGYDYPDDERLAIYRNTAGAITKMVPVDEMKKRQMDGLKKWQDEFGSC